MRLVVVGGEHPRFAEAGEPYGERLRRRRPGTAEFAGYLPDEELPQWFALSGIRPDDEWRQAMPAPARLLVGALTLPGRRYAGGSR